jgi:hypothetical protein
VEQDRSDSNTRIGVGPLRSTSTGIFEFGLAATKPLPNCSPSLIRISQASYSAPPWPSASSSSSITVTLTPFGVPSEYSCSGCRPTGSALSCVEPAARPIDVREAAAVRLIPGPDGRRRVGRRIAHAACYGGVENEPMATLPRRPRRRLRSRRRTSSRLAKRDAIAELLRGAAPDEVEIAVAWLSGEARQGRIGVGWATLAALRGTPAAEPQLTLARPTPRSAPSPRPPARARRRRAARPCARSSSAPPPPSRTSSSACSSASCARARSRA